MTKLLQHIEEMRVRLSEIAGDEQTLVQALGDALSRLDQQLLHDVRSIATEHEIRREEILGELQGLAIGIGMFQPPARGPAGDRGDRVPPRHRLPAAHRAGRLAPGDEQHRERHRLSRERPHQRPRALALKSGH